MFAHPGDLEPQCDCQQQHDREIPVRCMRRDDQHTRRVIGQRSLCTPSEQLEYHVRKPVTHNYVPLCTMIELIAKILGESSGSLMKGHKTIISCVFVTL